MYIPLSLAKKQLNIDQDFVDDDEYIMGLIDVAEQAVEKHVNEPLEEIAEKNGGCIPTPIFQAMLLLIGHMYQNREILGTKNVAIPNGYEYLISLYQNWNR